MPIVFLTFQERKYNFLKFSRSHLTDSVTIVRDEGAPRIQALATLLSAKLVSLEAPDMLLAANNWAVKSADNSLILWSNHLIYGFSYVL